MRPRSPPCLGFLITHRPTQPVGLLCVSDQPVAEAATYATHSIHKRRIIHALSGIRTRHDGRQAALDLRLRQYVHRDGLYIVLLTHFTACAIRYYYYSPVIYRIHF